MNSPLSKFRFAIIEHCLFCERKFHEILLDFRSKNFKCERCLRNVDPIERRSRGEGKHGQTVHPRVRLAASTCNAAVSCAIIYLFHN